MKKEKEMKKPKFKVGDKVVYNLFALINDVLCVNCGDGVELDYDEDTVGGLQRLLKLTIKIGDIRTTRSGHKYIYYEVEEIDDLTFYERELDWE